MAPTVKAEVRKQVFRQRKMYSQEDVRLKSAGVTKRVIDYLSRIPAHEPMEEIYLYASYGNEAATGALIELCLARNIKVALPRVCDDLENMEFYYIVSAKDVEEGYRGIPEPASYCKKAKISRKEQFMILPGVGFDLLRNRTGYGKGFYDRYLERYPNFVKIGICFEEQIFEEMEHSDNDIPMDVVITDQRVIES